MLGVVLGRALRVLIRGHSNRASRFHDDNGNIIPFSSLRFVPITILDWTLRVTGHRRAIPWLSYRAVRDIDHLLTKKSRVLEFGAGMSSVWFASRVAQVVSVESDPEWNRRLLDELSARGLTTVKLRLRPVAGVQADPNGRTDPDGCAHYTDVSDLPDASFDFALIDGACRLWCVGVVLEKVRPGGYVYVDNTDDQGREAGAALLQSGRCHTIRYYTDFGPGLAFVFQGLLAQV